LVALDDMCFEITWVVLLSVCCEITDEIAEEEAKLLPPPCGAVGDRDAARRHNRLVVCSPEACPWRGVAAGAGAYGCLSLCRLVWQGKRWLT